MADLGDAGSLHGGTYVRAIALDTARSVSTPVTPRPAPQGGLILLPPTGGVRG